MGDETEYAAVVQAADQSEESWWVITQVDTNIVRARENGEDKPLSHDHCFPTYPRISATLTPMSEAL
jgi:hypothetical protein